VSESQRIPWKRISIEAVAIVASILLAFAIDAWWADRQLDKWQSAQLKALRDEFSANLEALNVIVQTHDASARSLESLIAQIRVASDMAQVTVPDADLVPLIAWRTSDISTGTLDALLASGKLADIGDPGLRQSLAAWPSDVDDAQEDENLARDFVENVVVRSLLGQGVLEPAYRSRPLPGRLDIESQLDTETALPVSPILIEMATIRIIHIRMSSASISQLQEKIKGILQQIDAELASTFH
jgi:hypothetical protein